MITLPLLPHVCNRTLLIKSPLRKKSQTNQVFTSCIQILKEFNSPWNKSLNKYFMAVLNHLACSHNRLNIPITAQIAMHSKKLRFLQSPVKIPRVAALFLLDILLYNYYSFFLCYPFKSLKNPFTTMLGSLYCILPWLEESDCWIWFIQQEKSDYWISFFKLGAGSFHLTRTAGLQAFFQSRNVASGSFPQLHSAAFILCFYS